MGDISEKGDTVTELSADLIEKAEKELGEKQQWRQRDIEALRDIIKKDQGLYCPHDDDAFLLMFLRGRKFDYESAAKLIRRYYEVRNEHIDFYKLFRPSYVKAIYENGLYTKLPKLKDTDPQALLVRLARWDPSTNPMDDIFRANLLQIEKLIRVEENQITGVVMILDMNGLTWNHAKNITPFNAKRMLGILQHAMPCRLKGIHYVNVPHFFEYLFSIIRPFMTEKFRSRVHIHPTPDTLTAHFDADMLPKDLGGNLESEELIKDWAEQMINSEEEFKSWEQYGIKNIETVSGRNEAKSADPVGGVSGTFKKLSCD